MSEAGICLAEGGEAYLDGEYIGHSLCIFDEGHLFAHHFVPPDKIIISKAGIEEAHD